MSDDRSDRGTDMAEPTRYTPGFNYSGWEADHPTEPKPGSELDNDFAHIRHSIDETIRALKDVRRSDGKLNNAVVTFDALNPAVKAAIAGSEFDYEVLEEFAVKSANLQDLPDKEAARENLEVLGREANLSDLANVAEDRSALGEFATVADVENSHIPAVLTSIRTMGRNGPGDGGGTLLLEGGPSDPGAVQDEDGKWWKVAEKVVRPQMFGAEGDGVTDDQAALVAVVNFALLTGAEIYWSDNDFVSTGNIPGFHGVRHSGQGRIMRGGEVWHVTPKRGQRNTYHVASNGNASQDGLSPSQPTTLSHVVRDIIPELGEKALCGQWAIHLLPGNYAGDSSVRVRDWPVFVNEVLVYGDMDGSTHLTVGDGSGAGEAWWWRMASAGVAINRNIHFKDIHFKNWDPGG